MQTQYRLICTFAGIPFRHFGESGFFGFRQSTSKFAHGEWRSLIANPDMFHGSRKSMSGTKKHITSPWKNMDINWNLPSYHPEHNIPVVFIGLFVIPSSCSCLTLVVHSAFRLSVNPSSHQFPTHLTKT